MEVREVEIGISWMNRLAYGGKYSQSLAVDCWTKMCLLPLQRVYANFVLDGEGCGVNMFENGQGHAFADGLRIVHQRKGARSSNCTYRILGLSRASIWAKNWCSTMSWCGSSVLLLETDVAKEALQVGIWEVTSGAWLLPTQFEQIEKPGDRFVSSLDTFIIIWRNSTTSIPIHIRLWECWSSNQDCTSRGGRCKQFLTMPSLTRFKIQSCRVRVRVARSKH